MSDVSKPAPSRTQRWRLQLRRLVARVGLRDEYFLVVSMIVGAATGLFAHLFFVLIEQARHFAYGNGADTGLYAGRAWMLVLLPVAGALLVGHITYWFAREAKGHGVPEVMDALYRKGGIIRGRVAAAKTVASALTIGSGGSAGTEGPIIQIGAAIGSRVGQMLRIPQRHLSIVVACGVSAGIGAIFNAPIAGVLFALEIFLKDFSFKTFSPVVFSSVISCSLIHFIRAEDEAIFEVRALRDIGYFFVGIELPYFLLLGLLCGVAAVIFTRALYASEDLADRIRVPEPLKPALGAVGLGLAGIAYVMVVKADGMPEFFGNGYPAIQATLGNDLVQMTISGLVALFLLKVLATCLTLGSGGSGGVFAPSLLMGASLGGAFGLTLVKFGLIAQPSASAYALVGMGALVAGTTHAPLTAIVMLYEITRAPKVVLPVMFAAIIATAIARFLLGDSIYTLKLRRRGVQVGTVSDLTILRRITVDDVERMPAQIVHPQDPLQSLISLAGRTQAIDFVVADENGDYQGMVTGRDLRTALLEPEAVSLLLVGELVRPGIPTVSSGDTLDTVLEKFTRYDVESLPVLSEPDDARVTDLITRQATLRRYRQELDRPLG